MFFQIIYKNGNGKVLNLIFSYDYQGNDKQEKEKESLICDGSRIMDLPWDRLPFIIVITFVMFLMYI